MLRNAQVRLQHLHGALQARQPAALPGLSYVYYVYGRAYVYVYVYVYVYLYYY